jgi:AhpD family alkylhydroperoxidase
MHVAPRSPGDYPWWLRRVFRGQERRFGQRLVPAMVWARRPLLFLALSFFFRVLDRRGSPLPAVLRSLVMVRVSQVNSCAFCVDLNARALAERAGSPAKAGDLPRWRESPLYDAFERLALEYAEVMSGPDPRAPDDLMARLHGVFDDDALVELTALIAFQNLSSRFNSALDLPSQGFCPLPPARD